jgi:type IV pilus assembly protein PilA
MMGRAPTASEDGYSLPELLVVLLVIGLLAAIAMAVFLGQSSKAHDASAKENARNLASAVESCFADEADYTSCDTASAIGATNLPYGTGHGRVSVTASTATGYTIVASSMSGEDFTLERVGGRLSRTCAPAGIAGCDADGTW